MQYAVNYCSKSARLSFIILFLVICEPYSIEIRVG